MSAVCLKVGTAVPGREVSSLDSGESLEKFLAEVQGRALGIAQLATRDRDEALDLVQDAMIRLARRYGDKPAEEWRPLFYKILKNRIRDWQRRSIVRSRVMSWLPGSREEETEDRIAQAPDLASPQPDEANRLSGAMEALAEGLQQLPQRQREAFTLRTLEGLDVAETATAMGCSTGSVKTHYSRAVHRLRELLGEHWS